MLLVTQDVFFDEINNYDDSMGKVEDIPTAIIRKADGEIIKEFIRNNPMQYQNVHMVMKFKSVR